MPNVDDKDTNNKEIRNLLIALGFTRFSDENKSSFGIFH